MKSKSDSHAPEIDAGSASPFTNASIWSSAYGVNFGHVVCRCDDDRDLRFQPWSMAIAEAFGIE